MWLIEFGLSFYGGLTTKRDSNYKFIEYLEIFVQLKVFDLTSLLTWLVIWMASSNVKFNEYHFLSEISWGFLLRQLCKRQLFSQKFNCWL